ncbi:O-methyltransferase [Priestia koreensis]|uniref:O-methyltransferase n=1 Tax=Priestia koreensis TaxID=284581 RepID=UPI001F5AF627|nr:O-methyltransferase [Priestia koreensis]MCM3002588.1 O-methyltransferase [Priestia koreensis]UNL84295.1 O-methyltransferase [Priestia koreensis]
MLSKEVTDYVESLVPKRNELLSEMEEYAKEHGVPIMELIGIEALLQLLRLHQPKKILEIGTAIGYSALRMAFALPNAHIVTVERDEERYEKAVQYIEKAGCQSRIHLLFGDAFEFEKEMEEHGPYDMIFIDAAKGQYQRFFEAYEPFLSERGMIISDNVLFKGYVAEDHELIEKKRIRSLTKKIQTYNQWLMAHEGYETVILPIGDGIAISLKRGEEK